MSLWLEKYGPWAFALIGIALLVYYGPSLIEISNKNQWKIENIYSSAFDLASLITAFLFSFFTFARTSETEFLLQTRKTTTYRRFMKYLLTAIYTSSIVIIASIPFLVAEPKPTIRTDPWFIALILWFGLVIFAISATTRSLRQFVALAMIEKD